MTEETKENKRKLFPMFKNKRLNNITILGLVCSFVLIFMFQNCKQQVIEDDFVGSSEGTPTPSGTPGAGGSPGETPQNSQSNNPSQGHVLAYLAGDTTKTPKSHFDVGQSATLEFVGFNSSSNNFKWTVQRGFTVLDPASETNQSSYSTASFSGKGNHDIIVTSHVTGNDRVLSLGGEKLTVGQECDPADILEIKLESGSLVKGESVTFTLEDASTFTNINWKAQQPSQTPVEQANQSQIAVDLDANADTITVEVTAVDVDPNKSDCEIYRKKEFQVNDATQPHFDFVRPSDDTHPVVLKNNEIYKYKRTSQSKFIQIHVTDARACSWDNNVISCSGKENINQAYLDTSQCDEAVEVAQVEYLDSNNDLQTEQKSFYHFCPNGEDFCYFGPLNMRPSHHSCRGLATTGTPSTTTTPTTTGSSACLAAQLAQGYKDVNGRCLESCSIAGGTHTGTDCNSNDAYDLVLIRGTHEDPCCTRTAKSPVDGQCNNAVQNGCAAGTLAPQQSSGGYHKWHCLGSNNGKDATDCQILQDDGSGNVINGVCNNTVVNGCASGSVAAQSPSNGFHRWHCNGINGGTHALNCQKPIAINGVCDNTTKFGCLTGTANNMVENVDAYTWGCQGQHNGISVLNCRLNRPVDGTCDNSKQNGCLAGDAVNTGNSDDSATHFKWHCNGQHGGSNATDCQKAIPIDAVCDAGTKDTCTAGTLDRNSITTQNGFHKWRCEGLHEGANVDCQLASGSRCNYPNTIADYINTCKFGATFANTPDDRDYYKWTCEDASGTERCQRLKPFHGECHETVLGSCQRGVAGTVSTHIPDYATTGHYILPELPGDATQKSNELSEDASAVFALSTLDRIWSCEGGLSKVYCRATQNFTGQCPLNPAPYNAKNDFINYCRSGYVTRKSDKQSAYTWWCYGSGEYRSNAHYEECTRQKASAPPASDIKSQGECSKYRGYCRGGVNTVADGRYTTKSIPTKQIYRYGNGTRIRDMNQSIWTWECEGAVPSSNGPVATNKKCKMSARGFDGMCDDTDVNSCAGGVYYPLEDSDTHYRWLCFGQSQYNGHSGSNRQSVYRRYISNNQEYYGYRTNNSGIGGHIVYCSKPKFNVVTDPANGQQTIRPF